MALVRRGGKVVVGALVRVGVRQRDEHGRAVLRHDVRKCAKLIPAQTVEVVDVDRSR
jgi:hypothetical protein